MANKQTAPMYRGQKHLVRYTSPEQRRRQIPPSKYSSGRVDGVQVMQLPDLMMCDSQQWNVVSSNERKMTPVDVSFASRSLPVSHCLPLAPGASSILFPFLFCSTRRMILDASVVHVICLVINFPSIYWRTVLVMGAPARKPSRKCCFVYLTGQLTPFFNTSFGIFYMKYFYHANHILTLCYLNLNTLIGNEVWNIASTSTWRWFTITILFVNKTQWRKCKNIYSHDT